MPASCLGFSFDIAAVIVTRNDSLVRGYVESSRYRRYRDANRVSSEMSVAGRTMLTLNVYNRQGESVGTVEVDPAEFGGKINKQLLHDVVLHVPGEPARRHAFDPAPRRSGRQHQETVSPKGDRQRPRRHHAAPTNAAAAAPPRAPSHAIMNIICPRRAVRAATRMAILSKFQDHEAVIIDDLKLPEMKTKQVPALLKALKLERQQPAARSARADYDKQRLSVRPQHRRRGGAAGVAVQRLHGAAAETIAADQGGALKNCVRSLDRRKQNVGSEVSGDRTWPTILQPKQRAGRSWSRTR